MLDAAAVALAGATRGRGGAGVEGAAFGGHTLAGCAAGVGFAVELLRHQCGAAHFAQFQNLDFEIAAAVGDAQPLAAMQFTRRFGGLAGEGDAAEVAGPGGQGAGFEEARSPQPFIEAHNVKINGMAKGKRQTGGFTAEERAAMQERVHELKGTAETEGEGAVLAKIAAMPEPDRSLGRRLHTLIMSAAPELTPRLWYGMPAYAKGGKVVCFFQDAHKFKARYATLGFSDKAKLDEGAMWPTTFAIAELTAAVEAKVMALVQRAVQAGSSRNR